MDKDIAIQAENISKTFRIPHEKISTLRGAFVNMFRSNGYEEFKALDNVNFEVKKGEFFGIIGRNGSGKSTLLKILAGIYQPDKGGKVKINGLVSPFLELGIGFNPELSGRDNIYLNASVLGLTRKQIDKKFDDIVEFSELRRFIDQKVKNYSSGMQVRLMFSVAIHANREILLMDEVLAVGDTNFQSKCFEKFNEYHEQGKTVVLVTHDIGTVQKYCDRAMLLRDGKIQMIGDPQKVSNEYIYQNMSDEEKRIFEEERRKNIKFKNLQETKNNFKGSFLKIKKIELLDKDGRPVNSIKSLDKLEIRIFFEVLKKIKNKINVGVSFETERGQYLFGYSTGMDGIIPNLEKKYISLIFPELSLLTGNYFINVTVIEKENENILDIKPKIKKLSVFSFGKESLYKGYFNIRHEWI
jgi:ABC-type polysaccharide/polyol phosphate transport system ATPase subunit